MFTTDTESKILEYLKEHPGSTNGDLQAFFNISSGGISQKLTRLLKNGKINSFGKPAHRTYSLNPQAIKVNIASNPAKGVARATNRQTGASSKAVATQDGASAKAVATQDGANVKTVATQDGANAKAVATQDGASAKAVATQDGANVKTVATQGGADVKTVATQDGANAKAVATQDGASAKAVATQDGANVKTVATQDGANVKTVATQDASLLEEFCARFKIDAQLVARRHKVIFEIIYPGYEQWCQYRQDHNFYSTPWGAVGRIYDGLIWAIACISVLFFKRGWLMLAGLVLAAGVVLYQIFGFKNQGSTPMLGYVQQELTTTKEQLASLQNELSQTKEKLAQSENKIIEQQKDLVIPQDDKLSSVSPSAKVDDTQHIPMSQIIYWTQQGIPSDEIIYRINTHHSTYALVKSDIEYLRNNKVSDEVIQAMLHPGQELPPNPANTAAHQAASVTGQGLVNKVKNFITTKIQNGF